jgi:hypothetical protein
VVWKKIGDANVEELGAFIRLTRERTIGDLTATIWDTQVARDEKHLPHWAGWFYTAHITPDLMALVSIDTVEIHFEDGRIGEIRVTSVNLEGPSAKVEFHGIGRLREIPDYWTD